MFTNRPWNFRAAIYLAMMAIALVPICGRSFGQTSALPVFTTEESSVGSFYWVNGCTSLLKRVLEINITSGDTTNLEFRLARDVMVRPSQCPSQEVPSATLYVRAKSAPTTPQPMTIQFVVNYDTVQGPQSSSHTRNLVIQPNVKGGTVIK